MNENEKKKTILVVEDTDLIRKFISEFVEEEGYNVCEQDDGEKVMADILKKKPDLILLDMHLDDIEGTDILKEMETRRIQTPVIIISAYEDFDKVSLRDRFHNVFKCLPKPFSYDNLQDLIEEILQ